MKSKILNRLRGAEEFVSGQQLCEEFGVSRTAVWKAINQLKEEGYEIEAVHNKGYRLLGCPDIISVEEVKSRLHTDWAGCEVRYFDTLDSTNICAKRMAEEGAPNGTLVIADKQTAGRGRCGRVWETPKGTAIAMTLLMRPNLRPEKASMLTLVMGMAVTRAVNELYSLNCQIKWPNDVVWEGKKICGILVEMSAEMNAIHYLVIGCGINANMTEFPEELKEKAISLRMITGAEVDRAQIIQRSLEWLEKYYQKFEETSDMSGLMEEYNQMLVNRGSEVCVLDPCGEYRGKALGINDAGELQGLVDDVAIAKLLRMLWINNSDNVDREVAIKIFIKYGKQSMDSKELAIVNEWEDIITVYRGGFGTGTDISWSIDKDVAINFNGGNPLVEERKVNSHR